MLCCLTTADWCTLSCDELCNGVIPLAHARMPLVFPFVHACVFSSFHAVRRTISEIYSIFTTIYLIVAKHAVHVCCAPLIEWHEPHLFWKNAV